jgi:cytochrome c biogenesis protein
MSEKKPASVTDKIWSVLSSVTLAVVLIAILAVTSIVGTVIEQSTDYDKNIKVISTFVGSGAAPAAYKALNALGFMDMYRSWWFMSLLILFSVNLIVCSIERLPRIWKIVTDPMIPLKDNVLRNLGIRHEITVASKPEDARNVVESVLKAGGMSPQTATSSEDGSVQVFGQKGGWARFGVYVVHGSILVIFIGAIVGAIWGFKGGLNLPEGTDSDAAYQYGSGQEIPLGFTVRCNWYETEFYGNSDMPKLFKSELTVLENGREVMKKWIRVNDPLTYKGVTFYQSSYGPIPTPQNGLFVFKVKSGSGGEQMVWAKMNQPFKIPGTDMEATVVNFSPALTTDRNTGQLYTYTSSMNNPAVEVRFTRGGQEVLRTGWIWKRWPDTGKLQGGAALEFDHYWGAQYTGLQVRKDPGVWLVYLGCILMSIALYVAFFISHRKVWVKIAVDGRKTRILIGASAHKNKHAFEKDVEKMVSGITAGLEGGV